MTSNLSRTRELSAVPCTQLDKDGGSLGSFENCRTGVASLFRVAADLLPDLEGIFPAIALSVYAVMHKRCVQAVAASRDREGQGRLPAPNPTFVLRLCSRLPQ